MSKSRLSRNFLVCTVLMGVYQSGLLLAASHMRQEARIKPLTVAVSATHSLREDHFFH